MRTLITRIFLAVLLAVPVLPAQPSYRAAAGSKLWLDGSSTVNTFSCSTVQVDGNASFENDSPHVFFRIAVHTLDCGNDRMNADMLNAMKAETFPLIQYTLLSADSISVNPRTGEIHLSTVGELTIAGASEKIRIPITVSPLGKERYRVQGSKALSMHEFNITPPSAFFGLIRAHDQLVVNFDIVAEKNSQENVQFVSKTGAQR